MEREDKKQIVFTCGCTYIRSQPLTFEFHFESTSQPWLESIGAPWHFQDASFHNQHAGDTNDTKEKAAQPIVATSNPKLTLCDHCAYSTVVFDSPRRLKYAGSTQSENVEFTWMKPFLPALTVGSLSATEGAIG